jgi:hypothetical protein
MAAPTVPAGCVLLRIDTHLAQHVILAGDYSGYKLYKQLRMLY